MSGAAAAVAGQSTAPMIVFDWNGTIVLDAERARNALNWVLASHGAADLDRAAFSTSFKLPMSVMFDDLGLPASAAEDAERSWNERMTTAETELRAGAASALAELHAEGVWLGVVSAAAAEAVAFDRVTLGVPEVWSSVLAPATDKTAILRALRHTRRVAYYVGDTVYDMTCARLAGYIPVAVTGGYASEDALRNAGADHVITSLAELHAVLAPQAAA
ncbi:MAG: HAD family hydrolase [Pseudoclavibacter sp.]